MGCRNAYIRMEIEEGPLERRTFASRAKRQSLESSRVDRVWTFLWPEPATAPGRAGNANSSSVGQVNDRGLAVQHLDATTFERSTERCSTHRSQVVVSQDRDHGQARGGKQLASGFCLQQAAILGKIPGDKQQVGMVCNIGESWNQAMVFVPADVKIANRGNADPQNSPGIFLGDRRGQYGFHGHQAYPIARAAR